MILKILAVKDAGLNTFLQPFFTPHPSAGMRAFADEVNRPDSPMNKHPEDYDLYYIGEYDDHTAQLIPGEVHLLARAKELIQR